MFSVRFPYVFRTFRKRYGSKGRKPRRTGFRPWEAQKMARTVKDAKLDPRAARWRFKPRREPYWRSISERMAIGYRRGSKGGTWIARHYSPEHGCRYHSLGTADDVVEADGVHALSFANAQEDARKWFADLARRDRGEQVHLGPFTVQTCIDEYITWLEGHRKTARDARYRADALILPKFGPVQCDQLTTAQMEKWHCDLADSPALLRSKKDAKKRNTRAFDKTDPEAVRRRRSTANRTLTILKAALNSAWEQGKITSDDAWRRIEPFEGVDAARVRYLSIAETKRVLNACEPAFRRLAQAALATGARYSELAALRASDFNPDSGTVLIRASKSNKARHIVLNADGVTLFK